MQNFGPYISSYGVENVGIQNPETVYWNLPGPQLYEQIVRRREGSGCPLRTRLLCIQATIPAVPLTISSLCLEPTSENDIWWGDVNRSITQVRITTGSIVS